MTIEEFIAECKKFSAAHNYDGVDQASDIDARCDPQHWAEFDQAIEKFEKSYNTSAVSGIFKFAA